MTGERDSVPVEIWNVDFTYPGASRGLLEGVELTLRAGEVAILAGANGVGKSTLLGLVTGHLRPARGSVRVFGKNPAEVQRMPAVGVVSEPLHFYSSPIPTQLTGREILAWLRILDGIDESRGRAKVAEFGIAEKLLSRPLHSLSKGERQRFLLAVVLLRSPRLILADEPQEGLDVRSRAMIGEQFRRFADAGGTVLWVSHHLGETLGYADRFFRLHERKITEQPGDRYRVTFQSPHAGSVPLATLEQIPGLLERHFSQHTRVSITIDQYAEEGS